MQIRRLSGSSPRPWSADLHPRLTVVHGVPDEVASPLRAAIDALVRARISGPELAAAGLGGRVVVDGTEVAVEDVAERAPGLVPSRPLSHADLVGALSTLGSERRRDLDAELAAARSLVARAEAEVARARETWTSAREGRAALMVEGWRARVDAAAALRTSRRQAVDAAVASSTPAAPGSPSVAGGADLRALAVARLDAARAAHQAAAQAAAEAQELRDRAQTAGGGPDTDLDALRAELDAAERDLAGMPDPPEATPEERRGAVDRRAAIVAELDQVQAAPTERVRAALDAADRHGGIAAVEAAQVAVEWERVRDLVVDDRVGPPPGTVPEPAPAPQLSAETANRLQIARDRVAATRRGVAEATSSVGLDGSEVEALEAAHAEVLEAWEGSERRIGVGKARRRLEEAQLAEREILGRLGFASYTEFMMSGRTVGMPSTLDIDHARRAQSEAEVQLAAAEAAAEAELSAAPPAAPTWDADAARGRLVATLAALSARAADLLGEDPGDDVAASLRERIATDPVSDLRMALDEVGLPIGEVLGRDEVLARARAWVAQQEAAGVRRTTLAAERIDVEDHLARLDAADGARAARRAALHRRDGLREAVAARMAALGTLEAATARLTADRADLDRAAAHESEAEEDLRALDPAGDPGRSEGAAAGPVDVDLSALEAEARDAQTALDVAVSHLLPARSDSDGEAADATLGRAEARLEVARIELAGIESVHAARTAAGTADQDPVDADVLIWQILARLASQREAAAPGGPGPAPLVLDDPFGPLTGDDVVRVCEAVVGPASAVQVILITPRSEVVDWLATVDPEVAGGVSAHLLGAGAAS